MTAALKLLIATVLVVACLVVVVVNQRTVGWPNLLAMLAALGVLIALITVYNRSFR